MAARPAWDDLPSWDDLPDAEPQQASQSARPAWDELPSWDDLPDHPEPEGAPATFARKAASSVVPATGAVAGGALAGAGAAALYGAPLGPIGSLAAGAVGALAGGYAASKAQDVAKDFIPALDDRPQQEANAEAHPIADWAGEVTPFVGNPVGTLAQRGINAGVMGAFSVGQQAASGQGIDPKRVGADMVFGGVFPGGNRATRAVHGAAERMVPGRPNMPVNPAAAPAHADVDDTTPYTAVGDTSMVEPPPGPDQSTTGNPQSAPARSSRVYAKSNSPSEQARYAEALSDPEAMRQFAHEESLTEAEAREIAQANYEPSQSDMLTKGDMDPATSAALEAANPEQTAPKPAAPPAPVEEEPAPNMAPRGGAPLASELHGEPTVETGFPKPGEPVATGENEATPMPERPELKGKTNPDPTEGQKEAGNYAKARERLLGHEVAYENMKGSERSGTDAEGKPWTSTLPADYGYFRKTVGADKDHVDVYNLRNGDKHFIVDQRNPDTGKFDEHKVMANAKDLDDARDTYLKAFSDEKGLARLHDITEVSPDELTQWLKGASKRKPYGAPVPAPSKPVKERAVVQDTVQRLRAQGKDAEADQLLAAPDEQVAKAIEGKRTRKYGVPSKTGFSANFPVEGLPGSTANTKPLAEARSRGHKAVVDWYEKASLPGQLKPDDETNGELLDRIKGPKEALKPEGWDRGPAKPPKEWMWAKEAKKVLSNATPGNVKKFREAERLLRGNDEDVENYRGGNRVDADIALNRNAGDKAVGVAENQRANEGGLNTEEDNMAEYLDAKRAPGFDVPHEEAESMVERTPVKTPADMEELPRKTVDAGDTSLTDIDTNKISAAAMRKAEAAKLAGKKSESANVPSEARKASEPRPIKISDPAEVQRLLDAVNKAKGREGGVIAREGPPPEPKVQRVAQDLFTHFMTDDRASVDIGKVYNDFKRLLNATDLTRHVDSMKKTPHKSFLAWKSEGVRDDYMRSLNTDLHRTGKLDVNSWASTLNKSVREWPKKAFDSAAREKVFQARDADNAHVDLPGKQPGKTNVESLPADLKALYDKHLAPVFKENDTYAKNIHTLDPERIDPSMEHHVAHIMNGDTDDQFNMLRDRDNPMEQGHYRGLSVNASAAEDRKYFALARNADGKRFIVEPTDKGYDLWENGKRARIVDPGFEFENGKAFSVTAKNGQKIDFTMRHAMADEKTANVLINKKAPKYFHDAGFAAMVTNAQMGSMARHLQVLSNIMNSEAFKTWSTKHPTSEQRKDGWAPTTMPNFEGMYMHPDMRAVFDDFAGQPQGWWQKLNAAVTKLIFISPTAHAIGNVGGHTFASRGWDNLSIPKTMAILHDIPFAVQDVLRQGRYQRKMNINGAGTVYGKVLTRDMPGQLAKAFGLEVERNPSRWGPVADKFGVPMMDLVNSVYRHVEGSMWAASDVMETLRLRELQRKKLPMQEALIDAERDIPNYRAPTKLFGSRFLAQQFFNNSMFTFSRYHHGMINAYASMAKGLISPRSTMGDRVEAAGKLMSIGLMAMILAPLADEGFKKLTGNDNAEAPRRGPLTIPSKIAGALNGKDDIAAPARAAVTLSPLVSTAGQALANHDWRGKPIVEPGDVREGARGHVAGAARAIGSEGEHWARGLVAPYNMLATTAKKAGPDDKGLVGAAKVVGRTIRDQALDIKDVSPKAAKYERKIPITSHKDVTQRYRQGGHGPLEGLIDHVFGR